MKRKVLLMGQSGCGKTSMRSLIFSSYRASDTRRLGSTLDVEHSHVRFLGNLVLNLWDCGGQQSYMDSYLDKQRSQVFSNVGVLIYVFDLVGAEGGDEGDEEWERDLRYYKDCLSALYQFSPDAQLFCLLHKMDLVDKSRRANMYAERVRELRRKSREVAMQAGGKEGEGFRVNAFATSIWDESLYRAWSRIVQTQIPALHILEKHLSQLAATCSASEVVLFERTTFLVIAKSTPSSLCSSNTTTSANHEYEEEPGLEGFCDTSTRTSTPLGSGFIQPPTSTPLSSTRTATTWDPERFEKVSELIKNFKLSCQKLPAKTSQCQFQAMELKAPNLSAYIDSLTSNTYIMILVTDPQVQLASVKLNVQLARDHFERLQAINLRS
ncbi:related to GTR1 - GTP-binding protein [Ustilago sp. UG-2017a]|nr:related to GTR1 - GTP-binding protein [Ustilago sp. UG-2017a]